MLTSVWGTGVADLYATGEQGTLLRFDGTSWSTMSSGTTDLLWSVTGSPSGSGGAFAVGYNSTIITGTGATPGKTTPGAPASKPGRVKVVIPPKKRVGPPATVSPAVPEGPRRMPPQ